jgi:hypothetical protein
MDAHDLARPADDVVRRRMEDRPGPAMNRRPDDLTLDEHKNQRTAFWYFVALTVAGLYQFLRYGSLK